MTYRERFNAINCDIPERPDTRELDTYMKSLTDEFTRVYQYLGSDLLKSFEPKIIIKVKATPYQKSHFGEDYTFCFQSLINGRKSKFIPLSERDSLGIKERYKKTGGVYPSKIECDYIFDVYYEHYQNLWERIFNKKLALYIPYYDKIDNLNADWWNLYNEYLKSPEWSDKRRERLTLDDYECRFVGCHSTENLHVHHLNYDNVGDEEMEDLITLCHGHHEYVHNRKF